MQANRAKKEFSSFSREMVLSQVRVGACSLICSPCHRLRVSPLLLKRGEIFLEYCLFASLLPRDRLALAVLGPSTSPAVKAAFRACRSLYT